MLKFANLQYFPLALFARFYKVTNEALIAETAVWPIFFLSYECFLALKGSKLFILIFERSAYGRAQHHGNISVQK